MRIAARPGWAGIRAVHTGRVAVLDDRLIIRPGPRVVEARVSPVLHGLSGGIGMDGRTNRGGRTRELTRLALLIALSAVGAFIKIPGPTGTTALDALPGYLAAFLFSPGAGALVAALGHLASAATAGFPLTVPIHLVIALEMAGCAALAGVTARRFGKVAGVVVAVICNGVVAPGILTFVPSPVTEGLFMALLAPLLIAATLNAVGGAVVAAALRRRLPT